MPTVRPKSPGSCPQVAMYSLANKAIKFGKQLRNFNESNEEMNLVDYSVEYLYPEAEGRPNKSNLPSLLE